MKTCPSCLNGCGGARSDCPQKVGAPIPAPGEERGRGRPSDYQADFAAQAEKLCKLGATDIELGDFFGVDRTTIWRWSQVHEDFCNALKAGKEAADERVMRSLFAKAIGYSFDAVKILQDKGEPVIVPYREHVPPSDTAAIFWLKNRRPAEWREKITQEHTGPGGGPVQLTWGDGST